MVTKYTKNSYKTEIQIGKYISGLLKTSPPTPTVPKPIGSWPLPDKLLPGFERVTSGSSSGRAGRPQQQPMVMNSSCN